VPIHWVHHATIHAGHRVSALYSRVTHHVRSTTAASSNLTHGTWIIAAVALGALAIVAIGVPNSPVHVWLECNILEIPNISANHSGSLVCQVHPSGTDGGIRITSFSSSTGPTLYPSTIFTVVGTGLPIYSASSAGMLPSTVNGGDTFPNLLLQDGGDDTAVGNPQVGTDIVQIGNDSSLLGNTASTPGVTVLTSTSTLLQFRPDLSSDSNLNGPWDLWVSDSPIALGALANAGNATSSPYAETPVPNAILDQWDPANTTTTVQYPDQALSAGTVLASYAGGDEQAPTDGFGPVSGGGTSSLDPAASAPLTFGQSPNWTYDYTTTYDDVVGGPMTFSPGDKLFYGPDNTEYPIGAIGSEPIPASWTNLTMQATGAVGTAAANGDPTITITGTFTAVTPTYVSGPVAGSGSPETFGGQTIPIIFAPIDVLVENSTGGELASATLIETSGSLNASVELPPGTTGSVFLTLQTPSADRIQGVGVGTTQLLTIPAS